MRCFTYNWLSRLVTGTNPESGTTTYAYDYNGNVLQQTDARGTVIAMGYDGLNRLKSKNYTAGSNTAATATVTYTYDTDFKGALSLASNSTSNTSYTHDGFGRVASSTQTTGTTPYIFSYAYSLTDQLTQITYPSGRVVSYSLDGADRVTTVKNVTAGTNYASLIQYTAPGGISSMTMGNGIVQTLSWNDRAQPTALSASNNLLTLLFYPCPGQATTCASGNNGNLQAQTITQPGLSLTQTYSYDNLNRLTAATESGSPGWTQNYGYDVNGNRWVSANTNLPALSLETPIASSWYSSTVPNQINTWTYDAAGNVMQVGGMNRTFAYDAENRQVSATINSATATYSYDGNGLRVGKTSGSNTTVYVYDAFGSLDAEYSSQAGTSACDTNTCYAILDHLGSTRMLTDANGSTTVTRYDYLPFGQELLASTNGRTTGMGYLGSPDGSNPKYTGKNRDGETFLDWYEVRYMSGAQGRFQSVDPGNAGANPADPQTWNAYSYVGNNPLSYTDPSGKSWLTWLGIGLDIAGALIGDPFIGSALGISAGAAATTSTVLTTAGNLALGGGVGQSVIGGLTDGASSDPWSEQNPYNLGGGSLNTGGTFGSGNTDPFVFSFADQSTQSAAVPLVIPGVVFTVDAIAKALRDTRQSFKRIVNSVLQSPTIASGFIPLYGPVGGAWQAAYVPKKGWCVGAGVGAGIGHAVNVSNLGIAGTGNLSNASEILKGWGGSATAQATIAAGYSVNYSGSNGAVGGWSVGSPGFGFSYGYSKCTY